MLELGCGPGFYARRLAARFERLRVTGIDRSLRHSYSGRARRARRLPNCSFEEGDVLALDRPNASVDGVVASRLFMILPERERASVGDAPGVAAWRTLLYSRATLCATRRGAAPRHAAARQPVHLSAANIRTTTRSPA